ncbi:MAG TPA: hypothetical protein VHA11_12315 [Bryobacteraceae bacterium]|nr:hypothetical protein [Bryobacteraceae bacterium]
MMRRLAVLLLAAGAAAIAGEVSLAADGWFRTAGGDLFVPLGGFHGNALPVASLGLSAEEFARLQPHLFTAQKTAGQGHVDLWDASDPMLRGWFAQLAAEGVTAIRVFPRARVNGDTLDLCGKLNPELRDVLSRAFAAARPYGIRFLVQILPEPTISGYWNHRLVERYALPRYSRQELAQLTPSQRRFLIEGKHVERTEWFTDPDVLACQKLYLESALAWIATEPQVFALEVYNEQGWGRPLPARQNEFPNDGEDAEIAWTREIVSFIHQHLPGMPVTISHPGYGVTGYDPIAWSARTGVDFYSTHFYAGDCGANAQVDFAAVTAASSAIVRAGIVNFPGEWGVLKTGVPESIRRRAHRDALWLTLLGGAPGFMQWAYDFLDEYRWPNRVMRALPRGFSPGAPAAVRNIAAPWRAFQDAPAGRRPSGYQVRPERRADANLRRILFEYRRSLAKGVPLAFTLKGRNTRAPAAPLRAEGGYELAYLEDTTRGTWVAYLRSRKTGVFNGLFLGEPVKAPLRLRFRLPAGDYHAALIDLETGAVQRFEPRPRFRLNVSPATDSDYVLVVTAGPLEL